MTATTWKASSKATSATASTGGFARARLQWHRLGAPGARTGVGNFEPYDTRTLALQSIRRHRPEPLLRPVGSEPRPGRHAEHQPGHHGPLRVQHRLHGLRAPLADERGCARGRMARRQFRHQVSRRLCLLPLQPASGSGRIADQALHLPQRGAGLRRDGPHDPHRAGFRLRRKPRLVLERDQLPVDLGRAVPDGGRSLPVPGKLQPADLRFERHQPWRAGA